MNTNFVDISILLNLCGLYQTRGRLLGAGRVEATKPTEALAASSAKNGQQTLVFKFKVRW